VVSGDGSTAERPVTPPANRASLAVACLVLGVCLVLAACGALQPAVRLPAAEPGASAPATGDIGLGGGWDRSLAGLRAQDQRVADVAYRIVTANAALCADQAPQAGLVLQNALEYSPRLRAAAKAAFHLDDRPAVEAVAAQSPAALAGVRPDDVLLAIDDRPLAPSAASTEPERPDTHPASYAPIEAAQASLTEALKAGGATITLRRGDATLRLAIVGEPGCAYDAQVLPGPRLGASADGRHVFISAALVDYARSDDMLALVLGHEFAHDVLRHRRRLDQVGQHALGDLGSTPASLRLAEKEADYVGLYLTARAGYDISLAPAFWRRFPDAAGDLGWSHPGAAERAASLTATRDEILGKLKSGQPLVPNAIG
jgi:Zn-dependent protease with chaperone function